MADQPLRGLTYGQYGDCRRLRHAWFDVPSDWQANFGIPLTVRCQRCGAERRDQAGPNTGELVSRRYVYPEGYSYPRGEAPTANDFRMMYVHRIINKTRANRPKRARRAKVTAA